MLYNEEGSRSCVPHKILKIHHIHNNIHNISKYILKILNNLTSNAYDVWVEFITDILKILNILTSKVYDVWVEFITDILDILNILTSKVYDVWVELITDILDILDILIS